MYRPGKLANVKADSSGSSVSGRSITVTQSLEAGMTIHMYISEAAATARSGAGARKSTVTGADCGRQSML